MDKKELKKEVEEIFAEHRSKIISEGRITFSISVKRKLDALEKKRTSLLTSMYIMGFIDNL